ncbi:MAG: prepilin-type N-terminal cleavage/methylation domain-containing protein [Candidatus Sumerlaeaceae bacterium]|nr:prepilin-type N-terminal cleavage/methylation domain-containing protein [Candidatus Sumerlaeaceae bacterium]
MRKMLDKRTSRQVKPAAFTLIELMVVVIILSMLALLVMGSYFNQVERARKAAAKATIAEMEVAITRYQVDTCVYPPSLSAASPDGCGMLELVLIHSTSGNSNIPSSAMWKGPYLTVKQELLGDLNGNNVITGLTAGNVQILDPWNNAYRYVLESNYNLYGTVLPSSHPYATTETYYNPSTFQIVSRGPDGVTLADPNYGTGADDINNFGE